MNLPDNQREEPGADSAAENTPTPASKAASTAPTASSPTSGGATTAGTHNVSAAPPPMSRNTNLWTGVLVVIAALVVAAVIVAVKKNDTTSSTPSNSHAAVIVNGHSVPLSTYRTLLHVNQVAAAQQPGTSPATVVSTTMREVVTQELFRQYAGQHHLTVTTADIDQKLKGYEAQTPGGAAAFTQRIAQFGLNLAVFKQLFVIPSIQEQKAANLIAPVKAGSQPTAQVRHILIGTTPSGPGKKARSDAAAKVRASMVLAQLHRGASFNSLVKKYSDDPGSIATGGVYKVDPGKMVPQFEHAAFTLRLHTPTIVHTQFGYHIIEVLTRGTNIALTPAQQQAQGLKVQAWVSTETKKAKIQRLVKGA